MAFPRLQELAAAEKSNNLTDAMSVFIQRKINVLDLVSKFITN
ncbi:hypothetical protein Tco_1487257, partial [Tanacetum coccineum]